MAKKIIIYIGIVIGFAVLAYAYSPQLFKGKVINQSDISSWQGMAHECQEYNNAHPDDKTNWTGSMFSGMPTVTISHSNGGDYTAPLFSALFSGKHPANALFVSLIGGFLLFLAFGANVWLSILGAIAITFCSYNMQIIQVGHVTKMNAIAFMPWVLAAEVYAYRKKPLWGALFFAFALSFQIKANHPQISYYLAFVVVGFAIAELCGAIKERYFKKFIYVSALLLVGGLLGIATNSNRLIPTYEYSKHTTRGGSELIKENATQTDGGLDIDYATAWSYGVNEMPNLLIPNFNGGASAGELGRSSETYRVLKGKYQGAEQIIKQMPLYWGPQPFTAGPMYMGAISIFLFVLGLCIIRGRYKWWIVGVSLLAMMLAWGSHFMWFTEIFFNHFPLYNKFRTVSMILVVLQITIPVMGILAVKELFDGTNRLTKVKIKRSFLISLGFTAGVSLIFAIFPSLAGDFVSASDSGYPADIANALRLDRQSLLRSDAFRSVVFILLAAATLWFGAKGKLKMPICIAILCALTLCDLWTVDKRYLNDSHFVREREFSSVFNKRPVDEIILQDTDPHYRVLDMSVNTFNDSHVSYHHKTIGGYNAAKLQRYQDLIDYYISPEISAVANEFNSAISTATSINDIQSAINPHPALSMLNTKYIIINGENPPLEYNFRYGNAWIVNDIVWAENPNQEIESIARIDTRNTVILANNDKAVHQAGIKIGERTIGTNSSSNKIVLTKYAPNRLNYTSSTSTPSIAVLSEVYYPAGWRATIDGVETPILRANYALRAISLPEGEHQIELTFDPKSYHVGANISRTSSILLYVFLLLLGFGLLYPRLPFKFSKKVKSI